MGFPVKGAVRLFGFPSFWPLARAAVEPGLGLLPDEIALELGECPEKVEDELLAGGVVWKVTAPCPGFELLDG